MSTPLVLADDLEVRRSFADTGSLQLVWGSGSYREEFETDSPGLVTWVLGRTRPMTRDELAASAATELGIDVAEADTLVDGMIQHGLFGDEPRTVTPGEPRWRKLEWDDALTFHRATRSTMWRHDYSSNPVVMTWTRYDTPVLPDEPMPVIPETVERGDIILPPASDRLRHTPAEEALLRRKTSRRFTDTTLALQDVSDLLHWTFRRLMVRENSSYFTTQTYSNADPFTVHLITDPARWDELPAWRYVYKPKSHTLGAVTDEAEFTRMRDLLWGQQFADGAPLMLVVSANWSQFAWKYRSSLTYRMVHLDLGAFMQTALLISTALGLRTWASPALDDVKMSSLLQLEPEVTCPSYVLAIGRP